jgi:hypothetical protein
LEKARKISLKVVEDTELMARLEDAETSVAALEAKAKACDDGEAAIKRSKAAIEAGDKDEAEIQCREARTCLDRGLECESLARAVQNLEERLRHMADLEASRLAGSNSLAAAQDALLKDDINTAREQHALACEKFALAGASEMQAVLDALEAHIAAWEARHEREEERWRELLEQASFLILEGRLVEARTAIDHAREVHMESWSNMDGVNDMLDHLEKELQDAEERESVRKNGDAALQEAVDCVGRVDLEAAKSAIKQARDAYEHAGATAMRAAVEEIESAIADAEVEVKTEAETKARQALLAKIEAVREKQQIKESKEMWHKAADPTSGGVYYYHTETSWERPKGYDSDGDTQQEPPDLTEAALETSMADEKGNGSEWSSRPPSPDPELSTGPGGGSERGGRRSALGAPQDEFALEEYAVHLGIDVKAERHLFWIAEEGLKAPLPAGYTELADADGTPFFVDDATQESSWEHPLDNHYRTLVTQHRAAAAASKCETAAPPTAADQTSGP